MGLKKRTSSNSITCGELAAWLRRFADELDAGQLSFGHTVIEPNGEVELESVIKPRSAKGSWKLTITGRCGAVSEPDEDGVAPDSPEPQLKPDSKPRYKKVKKRMQKALKRIRSDLSADELPDIELARAFHADCLAITTYHGKGDAEEYELFRQAAAQFAAALDAGDLTGLRDAVASLNDRKKICHAKFK